MSSAGVVIFTMEGCPFCESAKSFLRDRGVEYVEVHAPPGSSEWLEMRERFGTGVLPQVVINDEPLGGYSHLVELEAGGEFYEKLGISGRKAATVIFDVIILGAGPAGLSAAIYTIRKLMKTLVISEDVGGQLTWTSDVDNYLGFSQVNASELVKKFEHHVQSFNIETVLGKKVISVQPAGPVKAVTTEDGKIHYGKTLIIATGGGHRLLNIPGERELVGKGVAYCSTCDAPLYEGADVAVVGGGNSGVEAALDLIPIAGHVHLVSITQLTADPIYVDKIYRSDNVTVLTLWEATRVLGGKMVEGLEVRDLKTGEIRTLPVEGVFVEIGTLPNSSLFIDTLATNHKGEILVDMECRTGLAGVFACGDVTNVPFKQVVVAVGEGAKAALSAYNYLLNQN